jgi:hypothetical protein
MRTRIPHFFAASLLFSGLAAACSTGVSGGGTGTVVLGITSKLTPGLGIDSIHVVVRADGEIVVDERPTTSAKDLAFPAEFRAENVAEGAPVEATIEGFVGDFPALRRLAATEAVAGREVLMEVELEGACMKATGSIAPTCSAPQTCVHGVCKDSYVPSETLPEYSPQWSTKTSDICKPKGAGDPIVVVGEGQADYLPMEDGGVAQVEAGPQGGHHVWVAVRLKNLTQSGSITSLTGHFPELGYDVGPFNVIFTFDPDEGGYCKIYGLRFQLDAEHDIEEMLGKTLEISATITDKDKDVGIGTRAVKLSDTILGG